MSAMLSSVEKAMRAYALSQVERCSEVYKFDFTEAKRMLDMELASSSVSSKTRRSKSVVKAITLPFSMLAVEEWCCNGLAYNQGLYTQCQKEKQLGSSYCMTCTTESLETGVPICGTVEQRKSTGLMSYRDTKNRKPVAYSKVMAKNGWTREDVETEAGKRNYIIDECHYAVESKKEKVGRPKAEKKRATKAENVEDLFAKLVETSESESGASESMSSDSDSEIEKECSSVLSSIVDSVVKTGNKKKKTKKSKPVEQEESKINAEALANEAKELKKQEDQLLKEKKIADLAEAKAQRELKLETEKAAKELKKQEDQLLKEKKIADLAEAKAQREIKLETEKAAKELKKQEDQLAKEKKIADQAEAKAQKIADLAAASEAKELKKQEDQLLKDQKAAASAAPKTKKVAAKSAAAKPAATKPVEKSLAKSVTTVTTVIEAEPVATKVSVSRITINGKEYLKTSANLLYNPATKEEVGIYDPETQTIKDLPDDEDDDEEMTEDGYESDDV